MTQEKHKFWHYFSRLRRTIIGDILLVVIFLMLYLIMGAIFTLSTGVINGSIIADMAMAVFAYWYLHVKGGVLNITWGKKKPEKIPKWLLIFGTIIFCLVMYFVAQIMGAAVLSKVGDQNFHNYQKMLYQSNPQIIILMSLIIAPICEEFLFRGLIYNTLKSSLKSIWAAIITALVFSLMHGTIVQGIGVVLLSLTCCCVYEYSGNLAYNILVHIGYNFFASLFAGIKISNLFNNVYFDGFLYVLLIAILLIILFKLNKLEPIKLRPIDWINKAFK